MEEAAEPKYNFSYNIPKKKSNKTTLILVVILLMILAAIGVFFFRSSMPVTVPVSTPTPAPSPVVYEKPSPVPLIRSDWSLEVLNGSGARGLAGQMTLKLQDLGYRVIKTGNADKQTYAKTEILVKKDLLNKIDLVIADLRDVLKIASIAGELKEGTASARIILGKDSI